METTATWEENLAITVKIKWICFLISAAAIGFAHFVTWSPSNYPAGISSVYFAGLLIVSCMTAGVAYGRKMCKILQRPASMKEEHFFDERNLQKLDVFITLLVSFMLILAAYTITTRTSGLGLMSIGPNIMRCGGIFFVLGACFMQYCEITISRKYLNH